MILLDPLPRLEKMGEGKGVEYSSRDDERQKEVDLVGQTCKSTRQILVMALMKGLEFLSFYFYFFLKV